MSRIKFKSSVSEDTFFRYIVGKTHHLKLGCDYSIELWGRICICRFIKVTRKGFNFLNLDTSKCIWRKHFYSKKYSSVDIPSDIKQIPVQVPKSIKIIGKLKIQKEA